MPAQKNFLHCFGVGDGAACGDRNHSSYLYQLDGASLLFDCGEPVSRSFKASGLGYDTIDRILLSHLHADHYGGFFMLMQGFWLERRQKPLPVHVPADGIGPLRQMLQTGYLFDELLPFRLSFEPLAAVQPIVQGGVRVTPFRTTHLDFLRATFGAKYPGDYAAYSFLVEAAGRRIAHTADLGAVEDLAPLLTQPLDLLVCELAHFPPEELFAYLKGRAIRRILFKHLGRTYWEAFDHTLRLAAGMLPGVDFAFARDGERFDLP